MSEERRSFLTQSSECTYDNRDEVIDKYVDNSLSEQKREEFEEHFFLCSHCFREVQIKQEMAAIIEQEGAAAFGKVAKKQGDYDRKRTLHSVISAIKEFLSVKWFGGALALAAVIILIILVRNFLSQSDLEEQRRLFAANSKPSPSLESLLATSQRGASNLEVLSPPNGINVTDRIPFAWKRDDLSELHIVILNNREEELMTFTAIENEYVFEDAATRLQPGLYYWKLEDQEDALYVGKFFINKPQ